MNLSDATNRLRARRQGILAERNRLSRTRDDEVVALTRQLASIDEVLTALSDPVQIASLDLLLTGLSGAGLRLELVDK